MALARNNVAQVALLESQQQAANEMENRLKTLEAALDQECVVVSDTNDRLRESEAALGAAHEQIRELEAALTAARIEIDQSRVPVPSLPEEVPPEEVRAEEVQHDLPVTEADVA